MLETFLVNLAVLTEIRFFCSKNLVICKSLSQNLSLLANQQILDFCIECVHHDFWYQWFPKNLWRVSFGALFVFHPLPISFIWHTLVQLALVKIEFDGCDVVDHGLKSRSKGTCWLNYPLQDENFSGTGPRWIPGFLCRKSGKAPERLRIEPELVSSEKNTTVSTERPESESLSFKLQEKILITLPSIFSDTCVM